jgi:hypothetical protein
MLTPYQFASNSPIAAIDLDGMEGSFISDFISLQARKDDHITARLSNINTDALQARNRAMQQRANAVAIPPNTDHPEDRARIGATIANIDYNKPENVMARLNQRSPATIGPTPPAPPANDYEAGAVKGVQITGVAVVAEACPTCFLLYGGVQTYSGIQNHDLGQTTSGILNIAGGALGTYARISEDIESGIGGNRSINPTGGNMNCAGCAIAGDATLNGNPSSAINHGVTSTDFLAAQFNGTWAKGQSSASITNTIQALGDGATGIVFGFRGPGQVGHFFNVVNRGGVAQFLDFQKNGSAVMSASETSDFQALWFLNTTRK